MGRGCTWKRALGDGPARFPIGDGPSRGGIGSRRAAAGAGPLIAPLSPAALRRQQAHRRAPAALPRPGPARAAACLVPAWPHPGRGGRIEARLSPSAMLGGGGPGKLAGGPGRRGGGPPRGRGSRAAARGAPAPAPPPPAPPAREPTLTHRRAHTHTRARARSASPRGPAAAAAAAAVIPPPQSPHTTAHAPEGARQIQQGPQPKELPRLPRPEG